MRNKILLEKKNVLKKKFNIMFDGSIDYNTYYMEVLEEYKKLKKEFPLLKLIIYPTNTPSKLAIVGWLVNNEVYSIYNKDEWYGKSIYVYTIFEETFSKDGVAVYDYYQLINREAIPDDIKHFIGEHRLCTHFDIVIKHIKEKVLDIFKSADSLVMEYKNYEMFGLFDLDCYPHNRNEAIKKYTKEWLK